MSELCYLMENAYSKKQLLRMERRVLTGLKFDLYYCPPLHFLLISASIAHCSDQVSEHIVLSSYLLWHWLHQTNLPFMQSVTDAFI